MAGKFLVFEGTDGSGKSSMLEELKQHLQLKGVSAEFVRDPGSTSIGGKIRKILLDPANEKMCPDTELLLYSASRAQMVSEIILPALERGDNVVSDRYIYSTLAYQGVSGKIPEERLRSVVNAGCAGIEPDLVIFLDVPAEVGLKRVGEEKDRMEGKGLIYMEEVRQRYLGMADTMPEGKCCVVDATRSILEVKKEVLEIVDDFFS